MNSYRAVCSDLQDFLPRYRNGIERDHNVPEEQRFRRSRDISAMVDFALVIIVSIEQEIADATSKLELTAIAKRLQLRKIPAGLSTEALKQVLLNVVGSHTVHIEKQCGCTHLKRQHYVDNTTGMAFQCKVPTCDCKKYHEK